VNPPIRAVTHDTRKVSIYISPGGGGRGAGAKDFFGGAGGKGRLEMFWDF